MAEVCSPGVLEATTIVSYVHVVWFAAILLVGLFGITGAYGKMTESGYGSRSFRIDPRLGWFFQESPSLAFPLFCLLTQWRNLHPRQVLLLGLFTLHYLQRSIIYPVLMRSRRKTSIFSMVLPAFAYCFTNGWLQSAYARCVSDPSEITPMQLFFGVTFYAAGLLLNLHSDHILRNLRKGEGDGQKYYTPYGGMFRFISCPNYLGEIMEWLGYAMASGWGLAPVSFAFCTFANLFPRALEDYPPWWKVSSFDTLTNTAFCDFKNFADNYAVPGPILRSSKILSIVVEDTGIHTDVVGCPEIDDRPAVHMTYQSMHRLKTYRRDERNATAFYFDDHPRPNNAGLDPLRVIDISSIRDKKHKLNLEASKVEFMPKGYWFQGYWYDEDDDGWYDDDDDDEDDDEDDNEERAFFIENDDDIPSPEEYEEPRQHIFDASKKRNINTATTDLPIVELEEVCLAAMELVKETFPDFNHWCAVFHGVAEEALTAAKLGSWQFVPIDSGYLVIPPANE
ncbi:3-oxo-5-alpha-steroid 4-dehydrogenase 1 [Perkinsus olseni]|uniref:3-oxo-5-alpha-steroid 4-dehydrogenase 1 n=1 Tax=Perkinsus olseni TaxID=32597 RepID=A0A7J6NVA3_PEROL|nr:3-oxo-5-alpha-steroid 4-dehydrogenase 1 [Perkinsus olseni]